MKTSRQHKLLYVTTFILFFIALYFMFFSPFESEILTQSIIRIIYSIIIMLVVIALGFKLYHGHLIKGMMIALPALLISINNFPWMAFLNERTVLDVSNQTFIFFILSCLSVGLFEELMFRGFILNVLLDYLKDRPYYILKSMVLSALLFGFLHVLNIFSGASISATLLQVSYSVLTGLLWAAVVLLTKNIWIVVILHATYNFAGLLFPTLGSVTQQFDFLTIILTIVVSVGVAIFYLYQIKRMGAFKKQKEPVIR